jgi:plastocyanin
MWVKVIMNYFYNIRKKILSDVIVCVALTMVFALLMLSMSYNMQPFQGNEQAMKLAKAFAQEQPNINATNLYDSGQMVLGNNVKHLAILIPNEGHHGQGEEDESRFIAQPFVPQNVVISPGTEVVWFNGDRGHEHNIVVTSTANTSNLQTGPITQAINGTQLYDSGEFSELEGSKSSTFNQTGEYNYADTIDYEEGFRMTGKITVADQASQNSPSGAAFDTIGALMVPSEESQDIVQRLRTAGYGIDSMTDFQDLRSAEEEDGGDQQTLLVWTTNGKRMSDVITTLQQISQDLPYG